jgi:hypothetical protein
VDGAGWEKARVELRVLPGTKFLLLLFQFVDARANGGRRVVHVDTASEFTVQFLEDIQVLLVCTVLIR